MQDRPRTLIRQALRSLRPKDGDIILVQAGTPMGHQIHVARLQTHLARTGRQNCLIAVVNDFEDMSALSEADMNRLGWQRISGWQRGKDEVKV